ncbi:MAG: hypothetical protein M3Q32_00695, partial [Pseudomonadota bacterium]|nr:hypothetical protein [Pseudomonadota bacterium]
QYLLTRPRLQVYDDLTALQQGTLPMNNSITDPANRRGADRLIGFYVDQAAGNPRAAPPSDNFRTGSTLCVA